MSNRRVPNALKHGLFAEMVILPGEDPFEFAVLRLELIKEWQPDGPTEMDAVFTLAKCMWCKARVQRYHRGQIHSGRSLPHHPAYDQPEALRTFCKVIEIEPDLFYPALATLPKEKADQLQKKFLRKDFETTEAWISAITNEINDVLLPSILPPGDPPPEFFLERSAMILPIDDFQRDLALEERIDALMNGAMKRLIQLKAVKPWLHQTPASPNTANPGQAPRPHKGLPTGEANRKGNGTRRKTATP